MWASEPPQEFAKGFRQESSKAFGATLPRSVATADNSDEPVPAGEQTPDVFVGKAVDEALSRLSGSVFVSRG